ncbi:MAG: LD-carboxypeptidase [Ruminococcaceae bacterium]|nr:LD-carboxypeptidase [Oscillospiraceae bacterium]
MIKPKLLKKGDKIAIVSLSWGGLGDKELIHKYYIAKERLENDFGLEVVAMTNALKGSEFVYNHPELRAKDLMEAFKDETIKGVFCAIGGDDSIRLLPYIDYDVIKNNPKIFMGYSDTTISHFMLNKAGVVSYYGPSVMCEFGEYVKMFDYTKEAVENILFENTENYYVKSSEYWSNGHVSWNEDNINIQKELTREEHGYEVLSGTGKATGQLLGGCIDVFPMMLETEIWPKVDEWKNKILLIETSEEKMPPNYLLYYLRNLGVQGILNNINGIIVGKPIGETYYEEYKEIYLKVLKEFDCEELPIIYNVNIGHAFGTGLLPLGINYEMDLDAKTIRFLESATLD